MGVIKRQGIKQSLVSYGAVAVAALSTVFIYPRDTKIYGLARFILDTAMFLMPFMLLGLNGVIVRYFPKFKNPDNGHNGFLPFMLLIGLGSVLFFSLLGYLFWDQLLAVYEDKPAIYSQYLHYLFPLAGLITLFMIFNSYSSNFKRIVVPSIFQNLIKFSLPVLILLYLWEYIDVENIIEGILLTYLLSLIGIIIYIGFLGQLKLKLNWRFLSPELLKEMGNYSLYLLLGGMGSVIAFRIDSIMISTLLDYDNNGIYGISAFIGNAIAIPAAALILIASPIIATAFDQKDMKHVAYLYRGSSINLLVVGLFLYVGIAAGIEDLFSIMPRAEVLKEGIQVTLLVGLAKIIDMGTSVNNQIINYSKYYRFSVVAVMAMALFNVVTNLIFIPRFQIIGAAMASLASIFLYNLLKLGFIYYKLKIQPFSLQTLKILGIALLAYLVASRLPLSFSPFLNLILRSLVVVVIYLPAVLYFKISEDINDLLHQGWSKIKALLG
ncbi:MAG: polysaccharide biosynthesis C-terminal domain-containing protein [Bacteroidota bacterium]